MIGLAMGVVLQGVRGSEVVECVCEPVYGKSGPSQDVCLPRSRVEHVYFLVVQRWGSIMTRMLQMRDAEVGPRWALLIPHLSPTEPRSDQLHLPATISLPLTLSLGRFPVFPVTKPASLLSKLLLPASTCASDLHLTLF